MLFLFYSTLFQASTFTLTYCVIRIIFTFAMNVYLLCLSSALFLSLHVFHSVGWLTNGVCMCVRIRVDVRAKERNIQNGLANDHFSRFAIHDLIFKSLCAHLYSMSTYFSYFSSSLQRIAMNENDLYFSVLTQTDFCFF